MIKEMITIITLYKPEETDFSRNGLSAVIPSSAIVTEELNGLYELSLTCPAPENGRALPYLSCDYVIKADAPRGKQLFRIYSAVKKLDNTISVKARHIFYDNLNVVLDSVKGENITADVAMKLIFSCNDIAFNASSTIPESVLRTVDFIDTNPVAAVLKSDTRSDKTSAGIIQLYGGELLRDNFNVTLMPSIGVSRGFTVRYRKNLTGLNYTQSYEDILTRVKPVGRMRTGKNSEETLLYLPEGYVDSPNIGLFFMPKRGVLDCPDIVVESGKMTLEEAFSQMRERVYALYDKGADLPKVNAKVDFELLSQTENYKEYAALEVVQLGDVISVVHEGLDVRLNAKCIKYDYDCLLKRYTNIELGDFNERLSGAIEKSASVSTASVSTALTAHIGDGSHLSAAEREWLNNAIGTQGAQ